MTKPRHEWTPGGSRDGRRYIESNDFAHDVTLFVSGDFSDDDERRAYTEHLAHKLNSIAELERDGPTGDFGHTHSDGTPWPCTMRHALNCMEMAAAAEANYADDMKRERDAAIKRAEAVERELSALRAIADGIRAEAERDAAIRRAEALAVVLRDARAAIAPPSVVFAAGYPLPAHLRMTAERAQLLGRIDAVLGAARAEEER